MPSACDQACDRSDARRCVWNDLSEVREIGPIANDSHLRHDLPHGAESPLDQHLTPNAQQCLIATHAPAASAGQHVSKGIVASHRLFSEAT
jgi:hypothetical protein